MFEENSNSTTDKLVFENFRFQNVFRPHLNAKTAAFLNSSSLKSVFEKLRFRSGMPDCRNTSIHIFKLLPRSVDGDSNSFRLSVPSKTALLVIDLSCGLYKDVRTVVSLPTTFSFALTFHMPSRE